MESGARIAVITVLLGTASPVCTWAAESWAEALGHWGYVVWGSSSTTTGDGGCVVVGQVPSFGANQRDGLIVRLGADGKIIWQRMLGGKWHDELCAVAKGADGSHVAFGIHEEQEGDWRLWCVRLSPTGEIISGNVYGFVSPGEDDYWDSEMIVREVPSGGWYILANDAGTIVRLDAGGSPTWVRSLDRSLASYIRDLQPTPDGGTMLLSYGNGSGRIVKVDTAGNAQWARDYRITATGDEASFYRLLPLAEGGYVMIGTWLSDDALLIVKMRQMGEVQWSYTYRGLELRNGNGCLFGGEDGSITLGGTPPSIMRLDSTGRVLWAKQYLVGSGGESTIERPTLSPLGDDGLMFSFHRLKYDFHTLYAGSVAVLRLAADGSLPACPDLVQDLPVSRESVVVQTSPLSQITTRTKTLTMSGFVPVVYKAGTHAKDLCTSIEE